MKQCGHYTQSTAESASIINAPYKRLSQRIKDLKDKWKALIMKGKAFSATDGSSLLNMHHTGKCWCLQEHYHLSHPSALRNRRLAAKFSSQLLISVMLVKIWNGSKQIQSLHRYHWRQLPRSCSVELHSNRAGLHSSENSSSLTEEFTEQPVLRDTPMIPFSGCALPKQ